MTDPVPYMGQIMAECDCPTPWDCTKNGFCHANVPAMKALIAKQAARIVELEEALRNLKVNASEAWLPSVVIHAIADAALQGEQQ